MDISELQLKINKNKAVSDLKAVEGQLGKTGEAADNLVNTLKDIGLTVGFGALVKETLQINNELKALDNRLSVIFGKEFDSSAISGIASELNISNNAAKSLLSTIGQFAQGMGQSSQFVKQFSIDLTKAAVDYGTFMGKTSTQDFNEIARKFAKATLGEVGELKEIGIVIDTNSESFKNYVKQIQEATGASEAQARQQAITNELLAQVEKTAGSASKNMFDGWAQLNRLMDEFKAILGEVGEIFSSVLGPILKVLGDIVAIDIVKHTLAWTIAIGGVAVGYIALMKTLGKISNLLKTNNDLIQLEPVALKKVFALQEAILKNKEDQFKIQKAISILENGRGLRGSNSLIGANEDQIKAGLDKGLQSSQKRLEKLNKELKGLDKSVLAVLPGIGGLDAAFIEHLVTLKLVKTGLKSTTAYTLGAAGAEKILAIARMNVASGTSVLTTVFGKLGSALKSIGTFFASFWSTLAAGATGFLGFLKGLGALLLATGKLAVALAALVIVFDLIKITINSLSGNEWDSGTISSWIAEKIVEWWDNIDFDELEKKIKDLAELNKKEFSNIMKIKELRQQLEDAKLDREISQMLPADAIAEIQKKNKAFRKEIKDLTWMVANMGDAINKRNGRNSRR